jgi:hypothetical protein
VIPSAKQWNLATALTVARSLSAMRGLATFRGQNQLMMHWETALPVLVKLKLASSEKCRFVR